MPSNRWLDKSQPQTLMMATVIMYLNAALALLGMLSGGALFLPFLLFLVVGPVAAGWGIANEKQWGYWLGLGLAVADVAWIVYRFSAGSVISLLFYGALVALLLHPQSRAYRRTWFK